MKKILTAAAVFSLCVSSAAFANKEHMDEHFAKMDTNGDGMISKDEHAVAAEKMFAETDTNNDGMISKDEMKDKMHKMKKKAKDVKSNTGITRDKGAVDDEKSSN